MKRRISDSARYRQHYPSKSTAFHAVPAFSSPRPPNHRSPLTRTSYFPAIPPQQSPQHSPQHSPQQSPICQHRDLWVPTAPSVNRTKLSPPCPRSPSPVPPAVATHLETRQQPSPSIRFYSSTPTHYTSFPHPLSLTPPPHSPSSTLPSQRPQNVVANLHQLPPLQRRPRRPHHHRPLRRRFHPPHNRHRAGMSMSYFVPPAIPSHPPRPLPLPLPLPRRPHRF